MTHLDADLGHSVLPVWAHPSSAGACATGDRADAGPDGDVLLVEPDTPRDLANFLDEPHLPG